MLMGHRVLVIGKGGREHAMCWKLAQSSVVDALYAAPGNPGIANHAQCLPVQPTDTDGIISAAHQHNIDLVVIGPEDPLATGLTDALEAEGFLVAGPSLQAARLESSKSFANEVMAAAGIPTACSLTATDQDAGIDSIHKLMNPHGVVVKADGLAAGKGVVVCDDEETAIAAIDAMMLDGAFGDAGRTIVIEERLTGPEVSVICFSDGTTIWPLQASCDYKRAYDDDLGPNTGGMGNYTPTRYVDDAMMARIETEILQPTIAEMARRGTPMKGILFAGLMICEDGPKVIEFNCRFGDPEAQVVLPTLNADLGVLLHAVATGTLDQHPRPVSSGAAVGVILASDGYPESSSRGHVISGLEDAGDAVVFHNGTDWQEHEIVTAGGRVLCVVGKADSINEARGIAYAAARRIRFDGAWMRSDIAAREA